MIHALYVWLITYRYPLIKIIVRFQTSLESTRIRLYYIFHSNLTMMFSRYLFYGRLLYDRTLLCTDIVHRSKIPVKTWLTDCFANKLIVSFNCHINRHQHVAFTKRCPKEKKNKYLDYAIPVVTTPMLRPTRSARSVHSSCECGKRR
jgi:hypothetical protein